MPIAYCFHGFGFNVPCTIFPVHSHIHKYLSIRILCTYLISIESATYLRGSKVPEFSVPHPPFFDCQGLIGNGDAFLETLHRFHLQSHEEGCELANLAGLKWLVLRKAKKSFG